MSSVSTRQNILHMCVQFVRPISSSQAYGLLTELCLNVFSIIDSAYCNLSLFCVAVDFSSPVNVCFIDLDALSTNSRELDGF